MIFQKSRLRTPPDDDDVPPRGAALLVRLPGGELQIYEQYRAVSRSNYQPKLKQQQRRQTAAWEKATALQLPLPEHTHCWNFSPLHLGRAFPPPKAHQKFQICYNTERSVSARKAY